MRNQKMKLCAVLFATMLAAGSITACGTTSTTETTTQASVDETTETTTTTDSEDSTTSDFTYTEEDIDATWEEASTTQITLDGTSISVDGTGADVSGNTVTINTAGTYVLSGELTDGQVIVSAEKEDVVRIVLNGVSISSSTSSAIYCEQSEHVTIILAEETQNSVSDATTYVYENAEDTEPDATIFSKDNLFITGTGSLAVIANYNNGIQSKDNLLIASGTYNITAVNNAIQGKDSLTFLDGAYIVDAENDALQSRGDLIVEAGTYSIKAVKKGLEAVNEVIINGGTIDVLASYEGIEGTKITINGGDTNIVSSDDGLNTANQEEETTTEATTTDTTTTDTSSTDISTATSDQMPQGQRPSGNMPQGGGQMGGGMDELDENCVITITGGTLTVNADGDGIDSNGNVYISGGEIYVNGPTNDGNGSLDYAGELVMTGGTIIAIGSSGMAQSISDTSTQVAVEVIYTTTQSAGSVVGLLDSTGNEIISYTSVKDYTCIVISSADLTDGGVYTLTSDGTTLGQITLSGTSTVVDETGAAATVNTMGFGGGGQRPTDGQMPDRTEMNSTTGTDTTTDTGTDTTN